MRRSERGFSLVEIMVVVGIIGALATVSMGSFTNYTSGSNFQTQASTVFESLTRARNMANSRDECSKLTIDGQLIHVQGYASGPNANCSPVGSPSIALPDFVIKNGFTVGSFSSGDTTIMFNPMGGVVDAENPFDVYITDPKGARKGFKIYPALGQIRTLAN